MSRAVAPACARFRNRAEPLSGPRIPRVGLPLARPTASPFESLLEARHPSKTPPMLRLLPLSVTALASLALSQSSVSIEAAKDNTIYSTSEFVSNGAGDFIHVSVNGFGASRRSLLEFDIASLVPAGATVVSASLTLGMSKTNADTPQLVMLHRLEDSWGEAGSNAPGGEGGGETAETGDATWGSRFYPATPWAIDGGDFVAAASTSQTVSTLGVYTWNSTPEFVADVQAMLDGPSSNFGWILIGEETFAAAPKRFNSRTNPNVPSRPSLVVTYTGAGCPTSQVASQTVRLGLPANANALQPGPLAPILGSTWAPVVDHSVFLPSALLDVLVVAQQPANLSSSLGTILVDLSAPNSQFTGAAGAAFALPIPSNCALVGLSRTVQVASVDAAGILELTNALDVVLGDS